MAYTLPHVSINTVFSLVIANLGDLIQPEVTFDVDIDVFTAINGIKAVTLSLYCILVRLILYTLF